MKLSVCSPLHNRPVNPYMRGGPRGGTSVCLPHGGSRELNWTEIMKGYFYVKLAKYGKPV